MNTSARKAPRNIRSLLAIPSLLCIVALGVTSCGSSTAAGNTQDRDVSESFDQALHDLLPDSVQNSGIINVGGAFDNPPMIAADTTNPNTPVGIAPELADAIAPILGVDFNWQNTQWPGQLPGLDSGSLDILWGQVSVNEDREENVIDLVAFYRSSLGFAVAKDNPKQIEHLKDICGLNIGAPSGSNYVNILKSANEQYCESNGKAPTKISEFSGAAAGVTAILSGQLDAQMDTFSTVSGIAASQPTGLSATAIPAEEIGQFDSSLVGIAVSKQNPGISEAVAGALQEISEDGTYKQILDKWESADSALATSEIGVNVLTGTPAGEKTK